MDPGSRATAYRLERPHVRTSLRPARLVRERTLTGPETSPTGMLGRRREPSGSGLLSGLLSGARRSLSERRAVWILGVAPRRPWRPHGPIRILWPVFRQVAESTFQAAGGDRPAAAQPRDRLAAPRCVTGHRRDAPPGVLGVQIAEFDEPSGRVIHVTNHVTQSMDDQWDGRLGRIETASRSNRHSDRFLAAFPALLAPGQPEIKVAQTPRAPTENWPHDFVGGLLAPRAPRDPTRGGRLM